MYIYNFRCLIIYTIVSILTIVVAFILTNMFAIPKDVLVDDDSASKKNKIEVKDEVIAVPVSAETIELKEVSDPVFSSEMMGKGVAFKAPESGIVNIYAPAAGKLSVVAKTGHAYGIKTNQGAEILVHLGLNTVSLNGEGFQVKVKEGESIEKGQLLGRMDVGVIRSKRLDPTIIMVITNTDDYTKIESNDKNKVEHGEEILSVQKKEMIS